MLGIGSASFIARMLPGAAHPVKNANNIKVARITDSTVSHLFPPNVPPCGSHTSTVKVGSSSVFVHGLAIARIGDSADAGAMTTGSSNVFAGG